MWCLNNVFPCTVFTLYVVFQESVFTLHVVFQECVPMYSFYSACGVSRICSPYTVFTLYDVCQECFLHVQCLHCMMCLKNMFPMSVYIACGVSRMCLPKDGLSLSIIKQPYDKIGSWICNGVGRQRYLLSSDVGGEQRLRNQLLETRAHKVKRWFLIGTLIVLFEVHIIR